MSKEEKELTTWPIQNVNCLGGVHGNHKKRDLFILERLAEGAVQSKLAKEFNLCQARIARIAANNKTLLDKLTFITTFATKAGRIRLACRFLQRRVSSKKDPIEILEYLRKECEGDVLFKQQINQFINVSDSDLDLIIAKGLQGAVKVDAEVVAKEGEDENK